MCAGQRTSLVTLYSLLGIWLIQYLESVLVGCEKTQLENVVSQKNTHNFFFKFKCNMQLWGSVQNSSPLYILVQRMKTIQILIVFYIEI